MELKPVVVSSDCESDADKGYCINEWNHANICTTNIQDISNMCE